jgi:hypothetical protein
MKNSFSSRRVFQVLLVALIAFMGTLDNVFAQGLPGDHGRWIGTLEGSMVDSQGSGLVYDFQFKEDGTVDVEKSLTVSKLKQTFNWTMDGENIVLSGDASGPIGELSDRIINYIDDTRYEFKHVDGITDV